MVELIKNILEASRERLKNPILGTYSISFILINWRPILFLLFSSETIENKIIVINNEYCCWTAILSPIGLTIIITFGIPYFMWLVEWGLAKSRFSRRKIRHEEKIIDLDNEIIIATKEFEIQNRKSGTKAIESLQDRISLLEKENQTLISSNNVEKDASIKEIEKLSNLLKNEIKKNTQAKEENLIEFSESVFETYNYLKQSDKLDKFFDHFDGFSESLGFDFQEINFYKNLGLVKSEIFGDVYTQLGYDLYHFLFETNYSKDIKNAMVKIIEKLNNHEIEIIKKAPSKDGVIFTIQDGFRKSLIQELVEAKFVEVSKIGYTWSKLGLSFRNLLALNSF